MPTRQAMDSEEMRRALVRISHEILEANHGAGSLALIGVLRRGAPLAERLAQIILQVEGASVPVGRLDIALYRDDFAARQTAAGPTDIPFDVAGKRVVLVDEVFFTGRTVRAAIDAIMDLGRPAAIQLAVLVDRGHRELPIRPDYVGKELSTAATDHVDCRLVEIDGEDGVFLQPADSD